MPTEQDLLRVAEEFLRQEVGPKAQQIDRDTEVLRWALGGLCDRGLMALKRPVQYGGPAIPEEAFRHFQETCARYSGTLSFLQTQHQSAVSMLARSENEALKQEYLPKMAHGEKLVGIGFSQLRRGGPPLMRAEPRDDGSYLLNGHVPWVTGFDFYPEFLIGATLPDGRALFAVLPLKSAGSQIDVSEPMTLAAMEPANTVTVDVTAYPVEASQVVFIKEAGWIRNNDQINIALQGHFALGCAQAGLDILRSAADKKKLAFLDQTHHALASELAACREETKRAQGASAPEEATEDRLKVRAWAIDLAVRCAHTAVAASSGAANSIEHPAQRVYREALVYTVSAQTTEIMEATVARLVRNAE
jgi:alkylation response protein AidB-like acyl-CoA dehydrogenase